MEEEEAKEDCRSSKKGGMEKQNEMKMEMVKEGEAKERIGEDGEEAKEEIGRRGVKGRSKGSCRSNKRDGRAE